MNDDLTHTEQDFLQVLRDYTGLIEDGEHVMIDDDEKLRRIFCHLDHETLREISEKFVKIIERFQVVIEDLESNMREQMILASKYFVIQFMRFAKVLDERLESQIN